MTLSQELEMPEEVPECTFEAPAQWLPEQETDVQNPEATGACTRDDADNEFQNCDCVPARLVDWDSDPNMRPDRSVLGVERLANGGIDNRDFFQLFNSREY